MDENKKFIKLFEKMIDLYALSNTDEMIYGNSYFEFGDRTIRLLDPNNIQISGKKILEKPYGKSILESIKSKKEENENI